MASASVVWEEYYRKNPGRVFKDAIMKECFFVVEGEKYAYVPFFIMDGHKICMLFSYPEDQFGNCVPTIMDSESSCLESHTSIFKKFIRIARENKIGEISV